MRPPELPQHVQRVSVRAARSSDSPEAKPEYTTFFSTSEYHPSHMILCRRPSFYMIGVALLQHPQDALIEKSLSISAE